MVMIHSTADHEERVDGAPRVCDSRCLGPQSSPCTCCDLSMTFAAALTMRGLAASTGSSSIGALIPSPASKSCIAIPNRRSYGQDVLRIHTRRTPLGVHDFECLPAAPFCTNAVSMGIFRGLIYAVVWLRECDLGVVWDHVVR